MGTEEDALELIESVTVGRSEEIRRAAYNPVCRLQDDLHRTKVVGIPMFTDMASVRPRDRLIAHWEREYSNAEFFVQCHVEAHPLEEVSRTVMKIVEHIVGKIQDSGLRGISNGLRIGFLQA